MSGQLPRATEATASDSLSRARCSSVVVYTLDSDVLSGKVDPSDCCYWGSAARSASEDLWDLMPPQVGACTSSNDSLAAVNGETCTRGVQSRTMRGDISFGLNGEIVECRLVRGGCCYALAIVLEMFCCFDPSVLAGFRNWVSSFCEIQGPIIKPPRIHLTFTCGIVPQT